MSFVKSRLRIPSICYWLTMILILTTTRNKNFHEESSSAHVIAAAAPEEVPHPHQGKVPPFQAGDPNIQLDDDAIKILNVGKPFQTQIMDESGSSGRGLVVQDIHAPSDIVWGRILDYNHYAEMVPKTMESQNYLVIEHNKENTTKSKYRNKQSIDDNDSKKENQLRRQTIYTRMKVGFPMVKLQFFVKHEYFPDLNSLTWTLDYSRKSDFDDSCGYWYVIPHPTKPSTEWTRVYYSVQVSMFDWVPGFVVNFMSKQALTEATGWVKKFSELEFDRQPKRAHTTSAVSNQENDAATRTSQSDTEKPPKKTRRRWFGRKPSVWRDNDDETVEISDICSSSDDNNDDDSSLYSVDGSSISEGSRPSTPRDTLDTAFTEFQRPKIGLMRYFLLGSVFALSIYNVHLCFSR